MISLSIFVTFLVIDAIIFFILGMWFYSESVPSVEYTKNKEPPCQELNEFNQLQDTPIVIVPEPHQEAIQEEEFSIMQRPSRFNSSYSEANLPKQDFIGDWRFCRNCGTKLSANAYSCPQCGEPTSLAFQQQKTICKELDLPCIEPQIAKIKTESPPSAPESVYKKQQQKKTKKKPFSGLAYLEV